LEKECQANYIEKFKEKLSKKKLVFEKKNINKGKGNKLEILMKENEKLKKELEELEKTDNEEKTED
jgi:hypothetical protein